MANPATRTEFMALLEKSGVCTPEELARLEADAQQLPDDPVTLAATLVRQNVITQFQAKLLLTGRYRGFKLGSYVIREQIGQGGMGTVYLADHTALRRRVALKVLPVTDSVNQVSVERFLREARAAAALDHPNIVRIFDVGNQAGVHFLAMEYVEGQTLDKLVEAAGPISCNRAVEFVIQAAAGLQHAHEKGFVHRDIKPGNLILSKEGVVRILDMGLARSFESTDNLTEAFDKGAVVGTADYISPEQAMNSPDLDIRADIYSLGATFFTLVTGRPPFEGTTTQKLLQHQMKAAPSITSIDKTFPAGMAQVLAKMLAKKPEDRYTTPADVIAALTPWAQGTPGIVAALSRTNLRQAPQLIDTLNEVVGKSTGRLRTSEPPAAKGPSKVPYILAGLAVLVFLVGAGAFWAYLNGYLTDTSAPITKPSGTDPQPQPPDPKTAPKTTPDPKPPAPKTTPKTTPDPKTAPKAPSAPTGVISYELDLTGLSTFKERGTDTVPDPAKPTAKKWKTAGRTGDGKLPPGWVGHTWSPDCEAEFGVEGPALTVRTLKGPPAASLASPEFEFPSSRCKLHVEYQIDTAAPYVAVKFHPLKPQAVEPWEVGRLNPNPKRPTTFDQDIDLKGATRGYFEFLTKTGDSKQVFYLLGLDVRDPAPVDPKPLFKLDLSKQEAFTQTTTKPKDAKAGQLSIKKKSGNGALPTDWYRWIEHPDAEVEYFADGTPGKMAIGLRHVSGTPGMILTSPQFNAPGGKCRVRLLYQTGPDPTNFVLRVRPPKDTKGVSIWDAATLPGTGGSWRLAVLDLDLKGQKAASFELSNRAYGPSGAVRIRELIVTEPPAGSGD